LDCQLPDRQAAESDVSEVQVSIAANIFTISRLGHVG
jgi:hypothetical protein